MANTRRANFTVYKKEPMLAETRAMLAKFYAPFNRKVSGRMGAWRVTGWKTQLLGRLSE